jgi:ribosomal protein L7Ae-like RNA K-turn-binding protein
VHYELGMKCMKLTVVYCKVQTEDLIGEAVGNNKPF